MSVPTIRGGSGANFDPLRDVVNLLRDVARFWTANFGLVFIADNVIRRYQQLEAKTGT